MGPFRLNLKSTGFTCLVCTATFIDRDVAGADWKAHNKRQQLQDVMRKQLLVVVQVASEEDPLTMNAVWQRLIYDAVNGRLRTSAYDG